MITTALPPPILSAALHLPGQPLLALRPGEAA